jgi:hypothetical protein
MAVKKLAAFQAASFYRLVFRLAHHGFAIAATAATATFALFHVGTTAGFFISRLLLHFRTTWARRHGHAILHAMTAR